MNVERLTRRRAAMRCSKAGKYLSSYIDHELDAQKVVLLESHLAQCELCSEELEQLRQLKGLFKHVQSFSAPASFRSKVTTQLENLPSKGFSLFPAFIRIAEAGAFVLAIAAGIMSGGMLINAIAPQHKGEQVMAALSLETFEALPPDSLGRAYLAVMEGRR